MDDREAVMAGMSLHQQLLLRVADAAWSCLVVFPLCTVYWSSTWKIMDTYLLADQPTTSSWVSLAIGTTLGILGYIILPLIKRCVPPGFSARHIILTRLYIYVHNFAVLNFWRGVWHVMDQYVTTHWKPSLICLCVALALLILARCSSNCINTPFHIALDNRPDFLHPSPRFRTLPETHHPCIYLADSVFTHLGIIHLCIQVWRALWNILDNFLFPGKEQLLFSYYISLGIGYGACVVFFLLQYPLHYVARTLHAKHPMLELVFEDFIKLFVIVGTVLIWRGGWGLFKDYFLMEIWHLWVGHGLGWLSLALLNVASSIGVTGVSLDAEFGYGMGLIFPIDYFLSLYSWWQLRKANQMLISEEGDTEESASYFTDPYSDEVWGPARPVSSHARPINS